MRRILGLMGLLGRAIGLGGGGGDVPTSDVEVPALEGLVGRDWAELRHTLLRGVRERDTEFARLVFGLAYIAAVDRLGVVTPGGRVDMHTWGRVGRELDAFAAELRRPGPRPRPRRGEPTAGDLGRRPTTPLPGGHLDYGAPLMAPERGLS